MSYQNESFGMMDEGYFVPRTEILSWVNNLLDLNLNKIEQLGAGSVYCQVIDVIHPGKVAINKINWRAKNGYEFIHNLKILQNAFDKIGIKRYVEVEKLAKAKYQDNLEFIQWLKRYYDVNCGERGLGYPAAQKRGGIEADFSFAEKIVVPKTYNGSGQIIRNEKEPAPKKTTVVSLNKPDRIKSPSVREPGHSPVGHLPPTQKAPPRQQSDSTIESMKLMLHDLEMKIAMINEIVCSSEADAEKVRLVKGVLNGDDPTPEEQQADEMI